MAAHDIISQSLPSVTSPPVTEQHMGLADVECVSGCTCAHATLNGRSDHRISVPFPLQFPASAAAGLLAAWPACACAAWHAHMVAATAIRARCLPCRCWALPCLSHLLPWHACSQLCTTLVLQVTQHEQCRIRVTISPQAGQTGEHKVGWGCRWPRSACKQFCAAGTACVRIVLKQTSLRMLLCWRLISCRLPPRCTCSVQVVLFAAVVLYG